MNLIKQKFATNITLVHKVKQAQQNNSECTEKCTFSETAVSQHKFD